MEITQIHHPIEGSITFKDAYELEHVITLLYDAHHRLRRADLPMDERPKQTIMLLSDLCDLLAMLHPDSDWQPHTFSEYLPEDE